MILFRALVKKKKVQRVQSIKNHVNTSFLALQKGCKRGAKEVQNTSKRVQNPIFSQNYHIFTDFFVNFQNVLF
jgi:hypothetical protein